MRATTMEGRAAWALLVVMVGWGLGLSACSGPSASVVGAGRTQLPGHLDYVGADASFVVSVDHIDSRVKTIRRSKAMAAVKQIVVARSDTADLAELGELARKTDAAFDLLETLLAGKVTLAMYDVLSGTGTPTGESEFVLIADADVEELIRSMARLDGSPEPRFEDSGDGIKQLVEEGGSPTWVAQSGGVGMVASSRPLIERTMQLGGGGAQKRVMDTASWPELTRGLRVDADVFMYLPDWRSSSDEWSELLGKGRENSAPRGLAAVAMLDEGIDVELLIQFDERDMDDAELAALLPALRGKDTTLGMPGVLPGETLAYFGVELQMDKLVELYQKQADLGLGLPPEQEVELRAVLRELLEACTGEFGLAVTSASAKAPLSASLGFPVPGAVLIAELVSDESGAKALKIVQGLLETAQMVAQPFGEVRVEALHGVDVRVYPLSFDPAVELAFAVSKGHFLFGTREGVSDVLRSMSSDKPTLAAAAHPLVKRSLSTSSNYTAYLNLKAIYGVLGSQYAPMLGMITGGMVGGADDPLVTLFEIFQFAGGSMVYREGASTVKFYLSAEDLP